MCGTMCPYSLLHYFSETVVLILHYKTEIVPQEHGAYYIFLWHYVGSRASIHFQNHNAQHSSRSTQISPFTTAQ